MRHGDHGWVVHARAWAVGLFLVGSSASARDDGTSPGLPVTLDWQAPAGCPSSDEVVSALRRLMPPASRAPTGQPSVRIEVVREDEVLWRVALTWTDGTAVRRRSFTAENCRSAADASALVIALALQTAPALAGEHDSAPTKKPVAAKPDDDGARDRPPSIAPRSHNWAAGVSVVGNFGDLPSPRPGIALSLRMDLEPRWRSVHVATSLAIFTPGSTESGSAGGRFWLATVSTEVCVEPAIGRAHVGGCAVIEGAGLDAHGSGQTESTTSRVGEWLLLGLRGAGEIPIASGWSVRAELGPSVGVSRPTFQAGGGGSSQSTFIFRPGLIVGRIGLTAEAHF
jgi:hypothetical protein